MLNLRNTATIWGEDPGFQQSRGSTTEYNVSSVGMQQSSVPVKQSSSLGRGGRIPAIAGNHRIIQCEQSSVPVKQSSSVCRKGSTLQEAAACRFIGLPLPFRLALSAGCDPLAGLPLGGGLA